MPRSGPKGGVHGWGRRAAVLASQSGCHWRFTPIILYLVFAFSPQAHAQVPIQEEAVQGSPNDAVVTALPTDVPSLEQRGDLYMVRKYYAEAVRVYRRLTELEPRNALFRNKLGIAYHQMQDLNGARREYQRAVQINPQYAQAINNLASVEYARKRYRSAINTYIRALKLTPGDPVIYSNLGTAYFAQEEYEYATQSFRYALMLDPEIFRRSGRVGTIVQQRADQNPATFNFYMAKTYASTGNVEETLQYLIKAWEEGYPELRKTILEDETFKFLTLEPRFGQLLALMESSGSTSATTPISQ
jgi:tetratricopeptide (TPR) repeat protein